MEMHSQPTHFAHDREPSLSRASWVSHIAPTPNPTMHHPTCVQVAFMNNACYSRVESIADFVSGGVNRRPLSGGVRHPTTDDVRTRLASNGGRRPTLSHARTMPPARGKHIQSRLPGLFTMDDWQEAALTARHVHNRSGKSRSGGGRGRRGGAFEVKKTFGSYDVKCPNAARTSTGPGGNKRDAASPAFDVFRLSEDGRGLLGYLTLPGTLEASVVLAGSRSVLQDLVSRLENDQEPGTGLDDNDEDEGSCGKERDESVRDGARRDGNPPVSDSEESAGESEDGHEEDKELGRFRQFEKNSFRSPKFWFQWKGQAATTTAAPATPDGRAPETHEVGSGRGYVVFSGNDCRSFKGTITCDALGWKHVSLSGWKRVSMSERDVPFVWS
ncbi:hypothetical protein LX36DRAFT_654151 [Colletotrichum falcatum]|nr:hypothetical protein LX36DRAFT_654151 [Colletotrichum falcatum]